MDSCEISHGLPSLVEDHHWSTVDLGGGYSGVPHLRPLELWFVMRQKIFQSFRRLAERINKTVRTKEGYSTSNLRSYFQLADFTLILQLGAAPSGEELLFVL